MKTTLPGNTGSWAGYGPDESEPSVARAYHGRQVLEMRKIPAGCFLLVLLLFSSAVAVLADASATSVSIRFTGTDFEGRPTFQLEWNAVSNATYQVQRSASLAPGVPWETLDIVTPAGTTGQLEIKGRSIPENSAQFYRLLLPQPEIFSVEPAVIAPGVTVDLYVLGQCFQSNDVVRINGVDQTNVLFVSSSLVRSPIFTPGSSGTYTVQLVRAGVVLSSFDVTSADVASAPELVLQGPPELPPASPSCNQVKRSKSNLSNNRTSGGGGGGDSGAKVSFEVQEGKKGLNAVNVRQARVAGGGGGIGPSIEGETDESAVVNLLSDPPRPREIMADVFRGHADLLDCFDDPGIALWSGEVQQQVVDLAVEGRGLDFIWARTYHSRIVPPSGPTAGGQRWTLSYDVRWAPNSSGGIDVLDGTGRKDTFKLQTNGTYTCPQFFREGTLTGGVFRITFADTGYWEFNPFDASAQYTTLARIVDRNGNTMSLGYDSSGRLTQIVDDLGRTNTVSYNSDGLVNQIMDFSGRTVTYSYYKLGESGGSPGDLKSVTSPPVTGTPNTNDFPSGKTTTYTYSTGYTDERENHLLLSVISPQGQVVYKHIYQHNQTDLEFLRCISTQRWTNTPAAISYLPQTPAPANQFAVLRCVINDPEGNVTEYFYDARNRCVKMQEFTGRSTPGVPVTDVSNRPTGQLRSDDPAYYQTLWSWNNDSLCTLEVCPGGQQLQCVYESDFDKSTHARKRADLRVARELAIGGVDLDGDGITDDPVLTWRYVYDPGFGSEPAAYTEWAAGPRHYDDIRSAFNVTKRNAITASQQNEAAAMKALVETAIARGITVVTPAGNCSPFASIYRDLLHREVDPLGSARVYLDLLHRPADPFGLARGIVANKPTGSGGTAGRAAAESPWRYIPVRRMAIFMLAAGGATRKGWDGTIKGRYAPEPFRSSAQSARSLVRHARRLGYEPDPGLVALSKGWDGTIKGGGAFVISSTDPRGNVTTGEYDDSGNLLEQASSIGFNGGNGVEVRATKSCRYNPYGQLTTITNAADANGYTRVATFDYYTNGPQNGYLRGWTVDAQGPTLIQTSYEYDSRGNLTRCMDANSNDWLYTWNALDQCVQCQTPLLSNASSSWRITTQFSYDANDNLTTLDHENRDENGVLGTTTTFRTQFVYDPLNRMTGCWRDKDGHLVLRCTEAIYDGNDNVLLFRSGEAVNGHDANAVVSFQYDERGLLYRVTAAPGSGNSLTNEFDYNPNGKIKRFVSELYVEKIAFDGFDRLASIEDPMGNQTTFNFDANDNLKVLRQFGQTNDVPGTNGNIRLSELHYQYDGLDRPVIEQALHFSIPSQAPVGDGSRTTTWTYAPNGQCVRVTDDLGHSMTNAYDTVGRTLSVADSSNNRVVFTYDGLDNVLSVASHENSTLGGKEQVFSCTNVYDALSRCVSTTDNVGNTDTCYYDSRGLAVRAVDAAGNLSTCAYDGLGRATLALGDINRDGIVDPAVDASRTWSWDDNDRLTTETDSNSNITTYAYDSLDRCTLITCADGTHLSLVWSPRSNLTQETDPNGTVVVHTYDLNDRCISNNITPGPAVSADTTFETFQYDGLSRLTGVTDNDCVGSFAYDSLDNCVSETLNGLATSSTYDSVGNRLSLAYPGGRTLTYTYDALYRCTSILESGASLASFDYDGPSRVSRISYANRMNTRIFYDGISGAPTVPGDFGLAQVSRVRHAVAGGSSIVNEVTLAWDRNGNKTTRADAIFQPAIPRTNSLALQYDGLDRLTRATVASGSAVARDTVYGLDRVGNRTNVTGAFCSGPYTMDTAVPPADFQANQYTTTPCDSRSYDDNGNLISRSLTSGTALSYSYDARDRLVSVSDSGKPVAAYSYDALGRRTAKTVYAGGVPLTTQFLYDGGDLIEERSGGVTTATYVSRRRGLDETDKDCGGGCPHQMSRNGKTYYFHPDDQGNVLALTDSSGNVVERYDYDDYGAVTFLTSDGTPTSATSSSVGNVYLFGGLRFDAETGLDCDDGGDYLEPQTGRPVAKEGLREKVTIRPERHEIMRRSFQDNNPWSAFQRGDKPTQAQFSTLIDSTINKLTDRYNPNGRQILTGHITLVK